MEKLTLNLQEAADFLGFKNKRSLLIKIKKGEIPAFKAGKCWMFYVPDVVDCIRSQYSTARKTAQVSTEGKVCHLANTKAARSGIQDSRSAASEFKNLRTALVVQMRKNTKIDASAK